VREAEDLTRPGFVPSIDFYRAARYVSRCVPLAEADTQLPEAKRRELAEKHATRAVELLREAIAKGYEDASDLKQNQDLDPLRQRDDFKKLLAELEAKTKG
jgi:hypothetical protein